MTREGFQLNPYQIAEQIAEQMSKPGWELTTYFDSFAHPDWSTGTMIVHDPVDRAVVVFVGPREEAAAVEAAARKALKTE